MKNYDNDLFGTLRDSIDKVIDHLYIGSCKSAMLVINNNEYNIKHIINISGYNLYYGDKIKIYKEKQI